MLGKHAFVSLFALCGLFVAEAAHAETLYAVSGGHSKVSTLYKIDPMTGQITERIGQEGGVGYVLTSLARHPKTGVMYGTTSAGRRGAPTLPDGGTTKMHLVTVDLATGVGKLVAPLRIASADGGLSDEEAIIPDIAFAPDGTLYAWTENEDVLATIDTATGRVTYMMNTHVNSWGSALTMGPAGLVMGTQEGTLGTVNYYNPNVDGGAVHHKAKLVNSPSNPDAGEGNGLWALTVHRKTGRIFGLENEWSEVDAATPDGGNERIYPVKLFELIPNYDAGVDATVPVWDGGGTTTPLPVTMEFKRLGTASWPDGGPVQIAALAWSLDEDDDKAMDTVDNCPTVANADQSDKDGDGRGDVCDACPTFANPGSMACPVQQVVSPSDAGASSDAGGSGAPEGDSPTEKKDGGCAVAPLASEDAGWMAGIAAMVGVAWLARRRRARR